MSIHGGPFSRRPQGGQEQGGRLQTWASKTGRGGRGEARLLVSIHRFPSLAASPPRRSCHLGTGEIVPPLEPGRRLGGRPESREKGTLEAQRGAASSTEEGAIHCRRALHFPLCQLAATVILRVHAEASFPIDLCARFARAAVCIPHVRVADPNFNASTPWLWPAALRT